MYTLPAYVSLPRNEYGELSTNLYHSVYSAQNSYPVYYVTADNFILCPICARVADQASRIAGEEHSRIARVGILPDSGGKAVCATCSTLLQGE